VATHYTLLIGAMSPKPRSLLHREDLFANIQESRDMATIIGVMKPHVDDIT
jgi:hypothetical protein